jgi:hypothetical protein
MAAHPEDPATACSRPLGTGVVPQPGAVLQRQDVFRDRLEGHRQGLSKIGYVPSLRQTP